VKKRFSEEQSIGFLREAEAEMPVKDLCRKHGFSEASYYLRRSKFGDMSANAYRYEPRPEPNIELRGMTWTRPKGAS